MKVSLSLKQTRQAQKCVDNIFGLDTEQSEKKHHRNVKGSKTTPTFHQQC